MVALGTIDEWEPPHGRVTTWIASQSAREAARSALRSDLPPSYQRNRHLQNAQDGNAVQREQPRLMIVAWDMPGVCDIPAMTAAINAHIRRHDTYHDWFEFEDGAFVRRTIEDPAAIDLVPVDFGIMDAEQVRTHAVATTPGTLEWDCFTFGIVQHAHYFTFYASVDHLHIDGLSAGLIFLDICVMYQGLPQATTFSRVASYRGYAARQRAKAQSLTLSSPEIRDWIKFARDIDGAWPSFPLPLGDTSTDTAGAFLTVDLLNAADTLAFDSVCRRAGARFSGGVMACAALAEHELTGTETYYGFTPYDTRTAGIDTMTVGWFASLVPVTVPIGHGSFPESARAAQTSFDAAKRLGDVPFERVLELATPDELGIKPRSSPSMMVSYLDVRKMPVAALWVTTNFGAYGENLSHGGVNMWITRHAARTTVTLSFPDNPTARESVYRYVATLARVFASAAKTPRQDRIPLQTLKFRTTCTLRAVGR